MEYRNIVLRANGIRGNFVEVVKGVYETKKLQHSVNARKEI